MDPSSEKTKKQTFPWKYLIVFGAILFIFLASVLKNRLVPNLPKPPQSLPAVSDEFFTTLREEIQEVGEAKSYYKLAEGMKGEGGFLKAAENYARAFERFKHAKKVMQDLEELNFPENKEECRKAFVDAVGKYVDASEILNENAKALYEDPAKMAQATSVTDARAKYEMGEKLMSKFLMEACKGEFFKFVSKSDSEKPLVYKAYRDFFLENFESQRNSLEMLLDYRPPSETPRSQINP